MKQFIYIILYDMTVSMKSYFFTALTITFVLFLLWLLYISLKYGKNIRKQYDIARIRKAVCSFALVGCYIMMFFETIYSRADHSRESLSLIFYFENIFRDFYSGRYSIENIFLFIPSGFLLAGIISKKHRISLITLISFLTSLLIESIQLLTGRGYFQISDLITNTLGGLIGAVIYAIAERILTAVNTKISGSTEQKK